MTCSSDNLTLPSEGLPAALTLGSGNAQTATVATPLPDSLLVRVTDSKSRPVEGTKVVFTPTLGGGDAVPDTGVTNADGRTGTRWLLGTTAGAQRMQAMVVGQTSGGALTLNFDATAVAAAADTVFAVRGNNQSAEVGAPLADSLIVKVTDRFGNAVSGTAVTWGPTGGGSVSPASNATGSAGSAATQRTLGPTAGPQGATATAGTLKGSPVVFAMTALPASPTALVKVSGDNQAGSVGTALTDSLVVRLLDGTGNGVPGRNVTFAVATGGGTTSPTSATTDTSGRAATRWTLGPSAGSNSLIATSSGFSVTFQATGNSSTATTLLANAPLTQNGTAGLPVGSVPSVRVTDANGNSVAGVAISFAVASGGGSLLPITPVSTNSSGIASLSQWVLGTAAGANTVTASAAGLTPASLTFSATGAAGAAAQLQVQQQPSASAQSGVPLATQPTVRLADVFGNPVTTTGTVVTASLASGSGTLGGTLTASTASGLATFTDLAVTGPTGTYTIRFTSGSLTPDTSAVIAIGSGIATRLAMTTQPSGTSQNGVAFARQPLVQVQDAAGNPVAGVRSVTAAINSGGGVLNGTATMNTDASGLATFAGLSISGTVGDRTLVFSSSGLNPIVSGTVAITAGAPTQMAISQGNSQTATAGSAVAVAPRVLVRDVSNNPVAGVAVTFAVATGGGSVLPVAPVMTNASGLAAATSWTLGSVAGINTLTATAAPAGIIPNPVTFTATGVPGGAGGLSISTQPSGSVVNGAVLAQAPVVQVLDVNGNPVATPTSVAITVGIAAGPGGTLGGLTTVGTNASGQATFSGLSITGLAGAYTLQFTSPGLTGVSSANVSVTAGAATQVAITTPPPGTAQSGVAMTPPTVVQLQDISGNAVSTGGVSITATLTSGGGTLTGTRTVGTNGAGASTFSNLILTGTAGPRVIRFTSTGLAPDTSAAIALGAGTATALEYVVEPSTVTAGQAIAPAVTVRIRDDAGNTVTTATNAVTMALGANPGGSTLTGTLTANAVAGVATFSTLSLNRSGTPYTLVASATGLTSATSAGFTVVAAGATTIAANSVTAQTDTAGRMVAAPPSVLVTDANGNPVSGVPVTFTVASGGGSIAPVTPVNTNAAGIATLGSWTLGNAVGANSVTATSAGLTPALLTFNATGVAGAPTQLVMATQPSNSAQSGVALTVQPAVRLADVFGNPVAAAGVTVTASLASGAGTLGGTLTAVTVSGVATFTNLAITGPTGAYTLGFAATGLNPVTSTTIGIGAGVATQLAMVTQPSTSAVNGVPFAQQPAVQVQDAAGNPVTGVRSVTAAIATGGGSLGGTVTVNSNASGLATFTNLAITGTVGARTLRFTSGSLTQAISGTITTTAGAADRILVNAGNGQSATVNTTVTTAPSVVVQDVSGNPVSGVSVTFAVATGGGSIQPVTPGLTNASGIAALTSWSMGTVAGANTVTATSGTLTGSPVTFTATATAGPATQLQMVTQPSPTAQSGVPLAAQPSVRLADAFGNLVNTTGTAVAVGFGSGTGTLGGTTTVTTAAGVAAFANLSIAGASGPYTLRFTSGALTGVTSTTITLAAGTAARLAMVTQPSATAQNAIALAQQPAVQVQDAAGNPVAGVRSVTASILTGGGTLGGTATVSTNAAGLVTFTNLVITGTVGARTLQFSSSGLAADNSTTVTLTAGVATQIAVNAGNNQTATVNTVVTTPPSAVVRDVSNNPVSGEAVTFGVTGGGGSILPVAPVVTNAAGVAALTSWTMGTLAGANTMTATSGTLIGSPVLFTATAIAGAATQLQMATQPSATAQSDAAFAVQPVVRLADAFGNPVATNGTTVTAAIATGAGTLGGTLTANTVSGVATFTNLAISGVAGPYTLRFTATGLTQAISGTVTLGSGAATQLAIVTQPSATAQNAVVFAQQPTVQVQDAAGNPVAGVRSVTAAIASGGGTLGVTTTVSTNAAGLATFAGLRITGTVGARTLSFSSAGLTAATSTPIALTAGAPTQMAVNAGNTQTATAGTAVAIDPAVLVRDVSNNPVSGVAVTFAVAGGGGSVLPATAVATNASGIATATSWTLGTAAGANSLTATAAPAGITPNPVTFTATAVAGSAGRLAMFTQPPTTAASGVTLAPAAVVQLQDALGNPVSTPNVGITASIASGPGGVLSGGTVALTDANGRATFGSLIITGPTGAYMLQFGGASLTGVTSSAINLTAGSAARVAVVTQPTTAQSGIAFPTAPTVQVQDAAGNPVAGARGISVLSNSGSATLSGTLNQTTNGAGLATFSGLVLTGPTGPNTLLFSSAGLITDTTAVITLTAGTATQLSMTQQPSTSAASGVAFAQQPRVQVRDASGNPVSGVVSVTAVIASGGGTLGGTTTVSTDASGLAIFTNLSVTGTVGSRSLQFTSGGLTPITSTAVSITAGAATQLTMVQQPSTSAASGVAFAQQPTVQVRDASGNAVSSVVSVTAAIATGGGALGGVATINTNASGLATFAGLSITGTVGARTLQFTSAGLTAATSSAVTITAGAPTQMAISAGNGQTATAGTAVTTDPAVLVRDASNNPVAGVAVTFAVATGAGTVLPAIAVTTNASGIATATSWTLGTAAGPNSLTATAAPGGITPNPVTFTATGIAGAATQVTMVQQPSTSAVNGQAFLQQPAVQVRDALGNPVAGVRSVTASIATGGGTLGGVATVNTDASGSASFAGLSITGTIGARTLQFSSTGLTAAASTGISVTPGTATQLAVIQQPSALAQNAIAFAQQPTVQVRDVSGNAVPGVVPVTVAIGSGGGTLGGVATVNTNAGGLATFAGLSITGTVGDRTLQFTSAGLTSASSSSVSITAGTATQLTMEQQPSATAANGVAFALQPTVQVRDASGNPVAGVRSVTAAIASGGGTLGGTATVNTDAGGLATFTGLSVTGTVGSRTLQFTSAGLTAATSAAINITAGAATQLVMVQQPSASAANGAVFAQQPTVQVQDASGNPVAGVRSVTAAIASGGGTLGGTATVNTNAGGLASFAGLAISGTIGSRTLQFASTGLTAATSTAINITAGAATQLVMVQQPSASAANGAVFAQQPTVQVQDASGNAVSGVRSVAVALVGGGTLGGTTPVNTDAGGLATFTGLSVTGTVGSRTLQFTSAGLTAATSAAINITAGAATQLVMVQQPSASAANGAVFAQQPTVQVQDASGNAVSGVRSVAVALVGGGTLGGTTPVNTDAGGLATFTGLSVTGTVGSRTLQFTSAGLTAATSAAINITAGAATQLVMVQQPSASAANGAVFAQQPTVQVQDASGNAVSGVRSVAVALVGGGTLGGTTPVNTDAGGLATFTGLSVTGTVGSRTLQFTSAGLTAATSSAINITAGAPTQMAISAGNAQSATAGTAVSTAPAVLVRDASNNPVAGVSVTFAAATGGGTALPAGAVLTNASGIATSTSWTLGTVAGPNSLTATAAPGGITPNPVTFTATGTPGAATALSITTPPTAGQSGLPVAPQPVVRLVDLNGNTVPTNGTLVTATLASGTGTLSGATATTVNGVATFTGLAITGLAGNYSLAFNAPAVTGATTGLIPITAGTPVALGFVVQPGNGAAGSALTTSPQVQVQDGAGNRVTTATTSITLALAANPGSGALSGVTTVAATAGLAAFPGLSLNRPATGYTLAATGGGLTPDTSTAFNVTPGAPASVAFVTQPSLVTAGASIAPAVQVEIRDGLGNRVTTSTASVSIAIGTNPGSGVLSGTASTNAVAGLATFSNLSINRSGTGYTLTAASGALTGATSSAFNVNPGTATAVAVTSMPPTGINGVALTPAAVVRLIDGLGNTVPTTGTAVNALLATGAGALSGTTSANTTLGVATFSNLILTGTAGPYTLNFGSAGLLGVTSPAVTLGAGAANLIASNSTTAQGGTIGQAVAAPPSVRVTDVGGNPVAGIAVTFAITAGGGTVLPGTPVVTNASGIATVTSWTLGTTVGTNTVTASAAVPSGSPVTFNATSTAGAANLIASNSVTTQSAVVGTNVGAPPSVIVTDIGGNPVSGVSVTFAVTGGGGSLGAPAVVATNALGIATATSWTLGTGAGTNNNTVTASAAVPSGSPVVFTASGLAGPANTIAANSVTTQTDTVGLPVAAPPSVLVTDLGGNPVAGVSVTFAVTAGSGSIVPVTATPVVTNASGVATLTSWTLGTTAGANTVTATAAVPSGSPVTFNATGIAGVPTALAFGVQPVGTTVGGTITPAVTVRVQDAFGNLTTSTATVSLAIGNNPGTATLGGTASRAAVAGIATFNDLTLSAAGVGYTLNASSGGLPTIPSAAFTIGLAGTTTSITSDLPDPSVTGQPVTVNYTVTSGGGTPTGTVTVSDGTVSCNAPVATGSCALTFLTIGPKTITANYPGDANFSASASAGAAHTVNQASTTSLLASHTPNPSTRGAVVNVTWAISPAAPGTGTPTGTVTVTDGVNSCNASLPAVGCAITLNTVGARSLTATYSGDANYLTSVSPGVAHTVTPAASTTTISGDTPDPSVVGQPYTVSFSVTGPGGTPTGNVTVADGTGATCLATVAVGSCALTSTTVGAKTLTASYAGDANYQAGVSVGVAHVVNQAASATGLTSSANPSSAGQLVTFTATVSGSAGTPTGTVQFKDGAGNLGAPVALVAGVATYPTSALSVASHPITAEYSGGGNYAGSTSPIVNQVVNLAASGTALGSSLNPSTFGASVTFTATVSGSAGTPTGTVQFKDGVTNLGAPVALVAGVATYPTSVLSVASHPITAVYSGDATYSTSTSSVVSQVVNVAASTTTITADTPDPSVVGQTFPVTFTVTGPGGTPTGNVTVSDGVDSCIGTAAAGTCNLSLTTVGTRTLTATYAGDASYSGGASLGESHTVNQAATTTTISTHLPDPSTTALPVSVVWSVLPTAPGSGTPTGTVTITTDGAETCSAAVGAGSCSLTFTTTGARTLTATYGGDTRFTGSASAVTPHAVN